MVNVHTVYESKYIAAPDLQSRAIELIISQVDTQKFDDGPKLIVFFQGKKKGLLLNVTNMKNITTLYGPETDNWIGKTITLFPAWVDYKGQTTEAVRVRGPASHITHPNAPISQQATSHPNAPGNNVAMDDGVPF